MSVSGTKRRKQKTRTQTLVEASQDSNAFNLIDLLRSEREDAKDFCDVTIKYGDDEFVLHKCLFGTMSEYFDKLFSKMAVENHALVLEDGDKFQELKKFVEKIYNGELSLDAEFDFTEMYGQEITDDVDSDSIEEYVREQLNSDRLGLHKYCDVTISTETRKVPVHKSIVAVHSEYFSKLFTTEMKEKYESTCPVPGISDDVMALVLDFIYTKEMWVKDDQFLDLLAATDYLCMQEFFREVVTYLVGLVTSDNCIEMWIAGRKCGADLLKERAEEEIFRNLTTTTSCEKYLIDQLYIDDFMKLIKGKIPDDQFMKYAISWIKQDIDSRIEKFETFFDMIETKSLTQAGWTCLLNEKKLFRNNMVFANAVISYMEQFVPNTETGLTLGTMYVLCQNSNKEVYSCDMSSLKPCVSEEKTLFVPKWSWFADGSKLYLFNPIMAVCDERLHVINGSQVWSYAGNRTWEREVSMYSCRTDAAVACYDDKLYVAGGKSDSETYSSVERYRKGCLPNKSLKLAPMEYSREKFAFVPHEGCLFAIGGTRSYNSNSWHHDEGWVESIEVYSISKNSWSTITETCPDLSDIKMTVVRGDKVYIVYGETNIQVATFDLAQRQWVPGKSAETALVARCAGFTLSLPGFETCIMNFP